MIHDTNKKSARKQSTSGLFKFKRASEYKYKGTGPGTFSRKNEKRKANSAEYKLFANTGCYPYLGGEGQQKFRN